jgi:hypothetical protein
MLGHTTVYGKIKILKVSLRSIAKETGHHFETIQKYIKKTTSIRNYERTAQERQT